MYLRSLYNSMTYIDRCDGFSMRRAAWTASSMGEGRKRELAVAVGVIEALGVVVQPLLDWNCRIARMRQSMCGWWFLDARELPERPAAWTRGSLVCRSAQKRIGVMEIFCGDVVLPMTESHSLFSDFRLRTDKVFVYFT